MYVYVYDQNKSKNDKILKVSKQKVKNALLHQNHKI